MLGNLRNLTLALFSILLLAACGGNGDTPPTATPVEPAPAINSPADFPAGMPALPVDAVQPWEELDANGFVVPTGRSLSALNADSEFAPGVERQLESGSATDNGEALRLSPAAGELAWGVYRLAMGGVEPGAVSVDANPLAAGDSYYLGVANFGTGRWDWHGPLTGSHYRTSLPDDSNYLTGLGNLFLAVVAMDNASIDVVGVAANPAGAESDAPPVPAGLSATALPGAAELSWNDVVAGDLAGYRVYYRSEPFLDQYTTGVQRLPGLVGVTRVIVPELTGETWFRVTAVDVSGNESPVSDEVSATPDAGAPGAVFLSTAAPSALITDTVQLTASGGESYDWDLDGDGVFDDLTDDPSGTAQVDTGRAGIIRPQVRINGAGGWIAQQAVSVIVSGNSRPVASAVVDPQSGTTPVNATYTGEAWDAEDDPADLTYAWDTNGDGTYNSGPDWNSLTPPGGTYVTPGVYNVKFRVTDSAGAWDVDTATVMVLEESVNIPPVAELSVTPDMQLLGVDNLRSITLDASTSYDPEGAELSYEFDPLGDGNWVANGTTDSYTFNCGTAGRIFPKVRVSDGTSNTTASAELKMYQFSTVADLDMYPMDRPVILNYAGNPAIAAYLYASDPDDQGIYCYMLDTVNPLNRINRQKATSDLPYHYQFFSAFTTSDSQRFSHIYYNSDTGSTYVGYRSMGGSGGGALFSSEAGKYYSMDVENIAGNPGMVFLHNVNNDLIYQRATTEYMWTVWDAERTITTTGAGLSFDLAVIDGRPAVAWRDEDAESVKYAIADDTVGATWMAPITLSDTADSLGGAIQLAEINGAPAVIYLNTTDDDTAIYQRATTASGDDPADWSAPHTMTIPAGAYVNGTPAITTYNGKPLVALGVSDSGDDYVAVYEATDASGSSWEAPYIALLNSNGWIDYVELAIVNGLPLIVSDSYFGFARTYPVLP